MVGVAVDVTILGAGLLWKSGHVDGAGKLRFTSPGRLPWRVVQEAVGQHSCSSVKRTRLHEICGSECIKCVIYQRGVSDGVLGRSSL